MSAKGTRLAVTSMISMAGRKWIPWQEMVGGQTTGAATTLVGLGAGGPVSVAKIGKNGSEFGLSGLGIGASADEFAAYIGDIYDWDLTKTIIIEPHVYVDHAQAAADALSFVTTVLAVKTRPSAANSLDIATVVAATTEATALTVAATDLAGIVQMTGHTIAGATLTSNDGGLLIQLVATLTTASADEFALVGLNVKYTKRLV